MPPAAQARLAVKVFQAEWVMLGKTKPHARRELLERLSPLERRYKADDGDRANDNDDQDDK
jgi:hypothetical protein